MVIKQLTEEVIQCLHQNQKTFVQPLLWHHTPLCFSFLYISLWRRRMVPLLSPLCSGTGGKCIMNTNESPPPSTGVLPPPLSQLTSCPLLPWQRGVNYWHVMWLSGNILSTLSSFISADSLTDWTSLIRKVTVFQISYHSNKLSGNTAKKWRNSSKRYIAYRWIYSNLCLENKWKFLIQHCFFSNTAILN